MASAASSLLLRVAASGGASESVRVAFAQQLHNELIERQYNEEDVTKDARQLLLDIARTFDGVELPYDRYAVLRGIFEYWIGIVRSTVAQSTGSSDRVDPRMPRILIRNDSESSYERQPAIERRTEGPAAADQAPVRGSRLLLLSSSFPVAVLFVESCYSWIVGGAVGFAAGLLFGAFFLAIGAVTGFLFGLPSPYSLRVASGEQKRDYAPNTNLEEISGWFSKMIIVMGVANLGKMRETLSVIGSFAAESIGTRGMTGVFAAAGVTLGIGGFIVGYVSTRFDLFGAHMTYPSRGRLRVASEAESDVGKESSSRIRALADSSGPVNSSVDDVPSASEPGVSNELSEARVTPDRT